VARAYVGLGGGARPGQWLINAGHSGLDGADYAERVRRQGLRPLFFLHDLIPITHPEYCRAGEADKHRRRLATMAGCGRGIVANSRATLDALAAWADANGLALPPCAVAPLAPARLPPPRAEAPLPAAYFVVLGTIEPRKNHLLLLHLWRELVAAVGEAAPRLVVIGQRGWECEQVADLLERCAALRGVVLEMPHCDDLELATWLHHARALLFPSFAEGYGMPLVEALSQGVPVIASELAAFREIAGDIPAYCDPLDGPGWRRLILEFAAPDSAVRRAQLARLAGYRAPTWAAHFAVVDVLLERL
jgi:glycosyltransferase involved in cell wall biosynthesis